MKIVGQYVRDATLAWLKATAFPTVPTNLYLALFTAAPSAIDGTGGTETTYTGYARQALGTLSTAWSATATSGSGTSALRQITQANALTFPNNTSASVTIVGWALYDAVTVGNFLLYGDLSNAVVIANGQGLSVPIGDVIAQM